MLKSLESLLSGIGDWCSVCYHPECWSFSHLKMVMGSVGAAADGLVHWLQKERREYGELRLDK